MRLLFVLSTAASLLAWSPALASIGSEDDKNKMLTSRRRAEDELLSSYSFERFVDQHDRAYDDPKELARRKSIFQRNIGKILAHNKLFYDNQSGVSHRLGLSPFMDRDDSELPLGFDKFSHPAWQPQQALASASQRKLRETKNRVPLPDSLLKDVKKFRSSSSSIPKAIDWRTKMANVVTPVKNQGGCGSCWAFASTTALESHIAIQTGKLFPLSVQELVSCVDNPRHCGGTGGCAGSTAEIAYDYVASHGMVDEWRFGYQSFRGEDVACKIYNGTDVSFNGNRLRGTKIPGAVASIVGFSNLPTNDYDVLMTAVATMGPIAVSVAASSWGLYREGIFDDANATTRDINHLVVLEGYGTDEETGQDYWLIRNSWGPLWGEDGYIRLKRTDPSTMDDPEADCKMDDTAADGIGCTKDEDGNDIVPPPVKVCGTSGVLFDSVVPIGGHLI